MKVNVYESRAAMGAAAASAVAGKIAELLVVKPFVNMVFAAAPSQDEFLAALREMPVEWARVNAFHMDEYLGLGVDAAQSFGNFLRDRLFSFVACRDVFYMDGMTAEQYALLLDTYPTDIVCMGIGENTHLAFNDPHVARFDDPETVKVVELDVDCRQQQVNDGCFAYIERVPTHAVTLSIPRLLRAEKLFCCVPGDLKRAAVTRAFRGAVDASSPASILREHAGCAVYLDADSAADLIEPER